jgi:outer membrane protein assembly factor BamB
MLKFILILMSFLKFDGDFSKESSGDPYAWRMVGYDPQKTSFYPYPLYPPMELLWSFSNDVNFSMLSGCAANGILYIPGFGGEAGNISAVDIETGGIIWTRPLNGRVSGCALSNDNSLLFVGTITDSMTLPTFFCLDSRTGEILWEKYLYSVRSAILPIDDIVFVQNLDGFLYALNLDGTILWMDTTPSQIRGIGVKIAYYNGRLYVVREYSKLLALNAYTGDTLWVYETPGIIGCGPVIGDGKVFFLSGASLYALDTENGSLIWRNDGVFWGEFITLFNDYILLSYSIVSVEPIPVAFSNISCYSTSGNLLWRVEYIPGGFGAPIVATSNGYLWASNSSNIFVRDPLSGNLIYGMELGGEARRFFWPIVYKNYYIDAAGKTIRVFRGRETPLSVDNLLKPFPNPFHNTVTISLRYWGDVSLEVYNLTGRFIKRLYQGIVEGRLMIQWDGRFEEGTITPGVYFVVLKEGGRTVATKRMIFIR